MFIVLLSYSTMNNHSRGPLTYNNQELAGKKLLPYQNTNSDVTCHVTNATHFSPSVTPPSHEGVNLNIPFISIKLRTMEVICLSLPEMAEMLRIFCFVMVDLSLTDLPLANGKS